MAVALKVDVEPDRSTSNDSSPARTSSGRWQRAVRLFAAGLVAAGRTASSHRSIAVAACAAIFASTIGPVQAMGLGAASLNSGLGEPLRLSFPVSAKADEDVGCVQVRPRGDDLPGVFDARVSVVRNGFQTRIEIRSLQAVNEPAIGLVVSVGCASPIAREYVVFLDPPVVPLPAAEPSEVAPANPSSPSRRGVRPAPVPRDAAVAPRRPSERAGRTASRDRSASAPVRPSRSRPAASSGSASAPAAMQSPSAAPGTAAAPPPVPRAGDRLTVAPTESPRTASGSAVPGAAPSAAPVSPGVPVGSAAPSAAATAAAPPTTPSAEAAAVAVPSAGADAEAAGREQALRQQQAELQRQIKALGDQIAALRVQTTELSVRNQVLEQTAFPAWLVWLLIALTLLATLIAAWLAWRYTQLRRTLDGAPWWGGHSVQAPVEREPAPAAPTSGLVALDPGTRLSPRAATQTETRSPPPPAATATGTGGERARPPARESRYPAAIDTDFTVSDIEAAMATVRTVSPPRGAPRPVRPDETDLGALGGPTLPSPFTEPPAPPPRAAKVVERDGDDVGDFVDLDIPPLPPAPAATPSALPASLRSNAVANEPVEPFDFRLDMPGTYDPLSTDSLKTTVVDREAVQDAPTPGPSPMLDFEFSTTSVLPPEPADLDIFAGRPETRHGATALDDLFAPAREPGIDTILDLDDRHGAPLSNTDIDRLTTTAVEGPSGEAVPARMRLSRFADLLNQVDEVAGSDPLRAIALLRQYVLRDENIPTALWLRLFALYKVVDKKPVYEALAEHFARRYRRPMVGWDEQLADLVPQTPLSAMTRIDQEIEAAWGKPEGLERIRQLLCDRDQDDAIVFDFVLQRDLLDAAKVFPMPDDAAS